MNKIADSMSSSICPKTTFLFNRAKRYESITFFDFESSPAQDAQALVNFTPLVKIGFWIFT
jgi:hypothetical protein